MTRRPIDRAASVAARLRNVAAAKGTDLELIFRRYSVERLLYRLSLSAERDRFILKGAMLFTAWLADPFRPTRDIDLLGLGEAAAPIMAATFRAVCEQPVENDGLIFDTGTIDAQPIRGQLEDGGVRIKLTARLGRSRIPVQIDIGFGDAVTPAAVEIEFPPLLDGPAPRIRSYPKETVVAEKLHAIVALGEVNTRLKDYYDLVALARLFAFDGEPLAAAIAATFAARGTALPATLPVGLGPAFAGDPQKNGWRSRGASRYWSRPAISPAASRRSPPSSCRRYRRHEQVLPSRTVGGREGRGKDGACAAREKLGDVVGRRPA